VLKDSRERKLWDIMTPTSGTDPGSVKGMPVDTPSMGSGSFLTDFFFASRA
jgi:hypothetical protein